jgi:hypothetical protein
VTAQVCTISGFGSSIPEHGTQVFQVTQEGSYVVLRQNGNKIAHLNKRSCRYLLDILEARPVHLRAYATNENLAAAVISCHLKGSAMIVTEINIYGREEEAEDIGHILLKANMYLQKPLYGLSGFVYHNPHLIPFEQSIEDTTVNTMPPDLQDMDEELFESSTEDQLDITQAVDHILDSLPRPSLLHIPVDRRIKTALLPQVQNISNYRSADPI